jgi:trimeric autotransporter adhesin
MTRLSSLSLRGPRCRRRPCALRLERLECRQLLTNFTVLNTNDSGLGSLRQAIIDANSASGATKIVFNIPGTGVHTIDPLSDLPTIITPMTINGYTQNGSSTNTLAIGDNAKITIEISGNGPGTTAQNAFSVNSGGTTIRGLAINHFQNDAVAIAGSAQDQIAGDYIGTDPTGTIAEGNGVNGFESIQVNASDLTIGGPAAADRTVVSASGVYGIRLSSGTGTLIENTYIGTDKSGTVALANGNQGIYDAGASDITIGGTTAALRNVISGNHSNGIALTSTAGNVVEGNYIGTDATGTIKLGNGSDGIVVSVGGNTIGGTVTGAGNLISGNSGAGLLINYSSPGAFGNLVAGNLIGTDESGMHAIPNSDQGINIGNDGGGGFNNLIGGTTAAARNVVSGNNGGGIFEGGAGSGNVIEGNFIGVDITGIGPLPNLAEGIDLYGSSNDTIGGTTPGAGNVIAANKADGVYIFSSGIIIQGNLIGLGADGVTPLGNTGAGITTYDDTQIGGTTAAARNIISANGGNGISLEPATGMAIIQGNHIGTDASGLIARGNMGAGVAINSISNNTIGGSATGAGNLICANGASNVPDSSGLVPGGITVVSAGGNLIQGNQIGLAADGLTDLGNRGSGVFLEAGATNTTISTNTIAFNAAATATRSAGVTIVGNGSSGNTLDGNSIYSNFGLGIDLGNDGVTLNSPGGPHLGPNDFQNFPVITSVSNNSITTFISGALNGAPGMPFTLQFFSSPAVDPSGYGQGETYLGRLTGVTTDTSGNTSFTFSYRFPIDPGQFFSATATDSNGNSSEFSQVFPLAAANPLIVTTTADSGPGSLRAAIEYANANSGPNTINFDIPGTGIQTIAPLTQLPTITNPLTIDGYSQPGSVANTNGPGLADNALPLIELSGLDDPSSIGLHVTAGNSSIRGLVINQFELQAILLDTLGGDVIAGNFIGTNAAGSVSQANGYQNFANGAITIYESSDNTIGGTAAADRNIISGNNGQGIYIERDANANVVQGNFIGADATGTVAVGNTSNGVFIDNGGSNTVGGTVAEARNVISGNGRGIAFSTNSLGYLPNWVQGNFIGTDVTGDGPLANLGAGIYITSGTSASLPPIVIVGGAEAGAGNTIAFNEDTGVSVISGIGGDVSGNAILGNSIFSNSSLGIDLSGDGVTPNTPGGPHTGPNDLQNFPVLTSVATTGTDTLIAGTLNSTSDTDFDLQFFANAVADSSGHAQGKFFLGEIIDVTTNADGNASFTATLRGMISPGQYVTATATDPGGNTSEFSQDVQLSVANPLIVTTTADSGLGSLRAAIEYVNITPGTSTISFDIPGAGVQTIAPLSALPVIINPVFIDGYTQPGSLPNTLSPGELPDGILSIELSGALAGTDVNGLEIAGGNSTVRGLVIDGFVTTSAAGGNGIALTTNGNDLIEGDYIGTDPGGSVAQANSEGISIEGGSGDTIGGTAAGMRNVISGNLSYGVGVYNFAAAGTVIEGNFIGTDARGNHPIANIGTGVEIDGSLVTLGGTVAGARNVISGNGGDGMIANAGDLIEGNFIGTDASGFVKLANAGDGIRLGGSNNIVGGTTGLASNVISGNAGSGILIVNSSDNLIEGNHIGSGAPSTEPINVGNGGDGVTILSESAEFRGPDANTIGGTADGTSNEIAFNGGNGVTIADSVFAPDELSPVGNSILGNTIYSNVKLGIDLGNDGPTPNTPGGPHNGPNDFQNYPVITSVVSGNETVTFGGTLNSTPDTTFVLQFFGNLHELTPGIFGGQVRMGTASVTTDALGNATFSVNFNDFGGSYSATATDPGGNTSEFSPVYQPVATTGADLTVSIAPVGPNPAFTNQTYSYTITVTNNGPQAATNVVIDDVNGLGAFLYQVETAGRISDISPTQTNVAFAGLAAGASVTATFGVRSLNAGSYTDAVSAVADQADPNLSNNKATVTETVIAPQIVATSSPAPINVFSSLLEVGTKRYQILVTWGYSGPADATTAFNIYRIDASGSDTKISVPAGQTAHDFVDALVRAGTTYRYEVSAVVGGVESARSGETSITVTLASSGSRAFVTLRRRRQSLSGKSKASSDRKPVTPSHRVRLLEHRTVAVAVPSGTNPFGASRHAIQR